LGQSGSSQFCCVYVTEFRGFVEHNPNDVILS
jgi:hypothetical protein